MNIPPTADKWIVFAGLFGVAMADYARSTGIPFEPVIWGVLSLFFATLFMLVYVGWRAFCRWLTRRLCGDPDAGIRAPFTMRLSSR